MTAGGGSSSCSATHAQEVECAAHPPPTAPRSASQPLQPGQSVSRGSGSRAWRTAAGRGRGWLGVVKSGVGCGLGTDRAGAQGHRRRALPPAPHGSSGGGSGGASGGGGGGGSGSMAATAALARAWFSLRPRITSAICTGALYRKSDHPTPAAAAEAEAHCGAGQLRALLKEPETA